MKKPVLINSNGEAVSTKSAAQEQCIQILQDALDSALKGEVHAMVLVACGPADFGVAIGGSDAARLYMGLGVAQQTILQRTSS